MYEISVFLRNASQQEKHDLSKIIWKKSQFTLHHLFYQTAIPACNRLWPLGNHGFIGGCNCWDHHLIELSYDKVHQHIGAWTKLLTFCRQYLEMHFVEWKVGSENAKSTFLELENRISVRGTGYVLCFILPFYFGRNSLHYIFTGVVHLVLSKI